METATSYTVCDSIYIYICIIYVYYMYIYIFILLYRVDALVKSMRHHMSRFAPETGGLLVKACAMLLARLPEKLGRKAW